MILNNHYDIIEAVIMTMWKARNIIKGAIKYLQVKK